MSQENTGNPPKWILKFFRWYCHPDYVEDLEGDLLERFDRRIQDKSIKKAKWALTKDILKLFRPGIIRPLFSTQRLNDFGMFRNYLKIATRNLLNQKLYSSINIGGLSIGITCFILIFLYVQHELSFNNFYSEKEKIHRIYQKQEGNYFFGSDYFSSTPAGLANKLISDYPEVEYATSVQERKVLIKTDEDSFLDPGLIAEVQFFNIFSTEFIKGNPDEAFENPNTLIITESYAKKLYGDDEALGKIVTISSWSGDQDFEITGVVKD